MAGMDEEMKKRLLEEAGVVVLSDAPTPSGLHWFKFRVLDTGKELEAAYRPDNPDAGVEFVQEMVRTML